MIDIYICEDNRKQLLYLKTQIENFIAFEQLDMQITSFTDDPSVILAAAGKSSHCGLYFLDIYLNTPETNGFLLAQNIRKIEPRCFIVFVTSHIELSYYTYQYKVEALDFIVKDNIDTMKNKIHECILNAYEKHTQSTQHTLSIFTATMPDGKQISVPYENIISFETAASTHKVILHGKNRLLEFPEQLNTLEKKLNTHFFRCHRSTIINLINIREVDYKEGIIIMCDGSHYPLSIRKKSELKKKLKQQLLI